MKKITSALFTIDQVLARARQNNSVSADSVVSDFIEGQNFDNGDTLKVFFDKASFNEPAFILIYKDFNNWVDSKRPDGSLTNPEFLRLMSMVVKVRNRRIEGNPMLGEINPIPFLDLLKKPLPVINSNHILDLA